MDFCPTNFAKETPPMNAAHISTFFDGASIPITLACHASHLFYTFSAVHGGSGAVADRTNFRSGRASGRPTRRPRCCRFLCGREQYVRPTPGSSTLQLTSPSVVASPHHHTTAAAPQNHRTTPTVTATVTEPSHRTTPMAPSSLCAVIQQQLHHPRLTTKSVPTLSPFDSQSQRRLLRAR